MPYNSKSPNKFLGGITAGIASTSAQRGGLPDSFFNSALGSKLTQAMGGNANLASSLAQEQANAASAAAGGTVGTPDQNPMISGGGMQDPFAGKTFSIVESPANMKGNARPVFNESTSNAAAMMYGSTVERQMSMPNSGSVTQMSAKQEKAFGPGSEVYEGGNTAIYEGLKEKE